VLLVYFLVLLDNFNNVLPKCKLAHFIRQSCLYTKTEENQLGVDDYVSKNYPIKYYYIKRGITTSFYYIKNNLISYYIHSIQNNDFNVVPLYDYVRNDYKLILSNIEYNFKLHHRTCVVKAPNRQVYLVHENDDDSIVIVNASKGTLLYNSRDEFSDVVVSYLFRSMPVANSFVIIVMGVGREIIIHVIDLINEKVYRQKCSHEKIKESLLNVSKRNDMYYEKIKPIESLDKFYISKDMASNINSSVINLVFYDRYVFNISLHLGKDILENVLSIIADYQDNELTVRFQINRQIDLITSSGTYEVDFGSTTILTSGNYKVDSRYDISQSRLYSVIVSVGEYAIINESNIHWSMFTLYYKNKPSVTYSYLNLDINNFNNVLFISFRDKQFVFANKRRLIDLSKMYSYYVQCTEKVDSDTGVTKLDVRIIDFEAINGLLLNKMQEINDTNWIALDITSKVKRLSLEDRLKQAVRRYTCSNEGFAFFDYAYYIDCEREEFYSLVCFRCELTAPKRYKVYIFKSKIKHLFDKTHSFKLVGKFESRISKSTASSILHSLKHIKSNDNMILRLFSNKWNSGNMLIDLQFFKIYDKSNAYYDYGHNRRSVRTEPINTSVASTLHLVRRILPVS
jgi:hypothetical protein